MKIHISKLDAAKRQLETAIRIFFHEGDPVSVHALSCASSEILNAIGKLQGVSSMFDEGLKNIVREDKIDEIRERIREPQNFIKHADRDPDGIIQFNPEVTSFHIWDACRLYKLLTSEESKDMVIFNLWMALKNPDFLIMAEGRGAAAEVLKRLDLNNRKKFYMDVSNGYDQSFWNNFK